jgi:2-polyprenyl-6-hydroxyphenyl methylase / 3-demethylubiquinone-9 3-methyltransferase
MNNTNASKELHSGTYVEMYEKKPISRIQRLVPVMRLNGGESLADFACGNAMLLPLVASTVKHYYGIDFSEDFIESATRRSQKAGIKNCSFYCQDIVSFCDDHPTFFDVATAMDFSEHIDNSDFNRIFSAIYRSLKPGGKLFMHTPNLDFFIERLKNKGIIHQFPEHIAVRNADQNIAILEQCGFNKSHINVRYIAHYNVLKILHPLSWIPLIGKLFSARLFIECTK